MSRRNPLPRRPRAGGARSIPCAAAATLMLLAAVPAAAQFAPVPDQGWRESVDARRPVSGHAVVGMALAGGAPGAKLYVYTPVALPPGTLLRVDLESPDGRFHGSGLFRGQAGARRWTPLELLPAGARPGAPADLTPDQLALQVRVASADGPMAQRALLASWVDRGDEPPGGTLRLHVNSQRAQQVQIAYPGGGERPACERLRVPSTVRYDVVCDVELGRVAAGRRVTLQRRDGFSSEPITVDLPL